MLTRDHRAPTPERPARNRTNVRTSIRRAALRAFGTLTPALSERWAIARFSTPTRTAHPGPRPAGLRGHRFTFSGRTGGLAAWDFGQGPTVLLAHGWSGHASQMSAFVAPLVSAGYHVVCFDQPAHGLSDGARTNMLEFREALLTFSRRLGPLAGVIAHSLGATATMLAVDRGLRADRLVLLAPPIDPFPFARAFAAHVGLPPARSDGLVRRLQGFLHADLGDRYAVEAAASADSPMLVVHDQNDRAVPFQHGHTLAAAAPHARLWPVTGLGHLRLLADPAVVAGAVEFLRSGVAPPRAADQRNVEQLSLTGQLAPIEHTAQPSSTSPSQSSSTLLPQISGAIG
jgi:pimeloyl-ACP methyl ester carboxylesterase